MECLQRRPSGVYFVRLVVPERLRVLAGRRELVASTGARDLALAKIVAGPVLTAWRQRFVELDRMLMDGDIDLARLTVGSPLLSLGEYCTLDTACRASGIGRATLLREAVEGRLHYFFRARHLQGYRLPESALPSTSEDGEWQRIVPAPAQMPEAARAVAYSGVVAIPRTCDAAAAHLAGTTHTVVLFALKEGGSDVFAPNDPVEVGPGDVLLLSAQVERVRKRMVGLVTTEQLAAAAAAPDKPAAAHHPNRRRPLQESVDAFLIDHQRHRGPEQTTRVRSACQLFVDLMGPDLRGADLTRDVVRRFRDLELPRVPANENKVRLQFGSKSVLQSIAAVHGQNWPSMSSPEQVKRLKWIGDWLGWLGREGWADNLLADGLIGGGTAGRSAAKARGNRRAQDMRAEFTQNELAAVFSAQWFVEGKGVKTKVGTYRTWMPYRYWIPLLALLTGARLNELAQLHLKDLRQGEAGTWLLDINDDASPSGALTKRLKNPQSRRLVPVHSKLLELGLADWRGCLEAAGHDRLFPELLFDEQKGYGKAVTKWFSGILSDLNLQRDGMKVFHSFRHTVANRLQQTAGVNAITVSQILGHERGNTTTTKTYRKDAGIAAGGEVVKTIELLQFDCLAKVKPFICSAGLSALKDALDRKRKLPQLF